MNTVLYSTSNIRVQRDVPTFPPIIPCVSFTCSHTVIFGHHYDRQQFEDYKLEEDQYQNDLSYSRGNIGKGGIGGGIRGATVDERTKVRISQTLKKNMQKQRAVWGGTSSIKKVVSGTASSVAFTPVQGLEIVNPNAVERVNEANQKYFSATSGFLSVNKTPKPTQ